MENSAAAGMAGCARWLLPPPQCHQGPAGRVVELVPHGGGLLAYAERDRTGRRCEVERISSNPAKMVCEDSAASCSTAKPPRSAWRA
ncbi:MAG: hypothetical protein V8S24_07230 [Gordonibacter pamelaeae]